MWLYNFQRPIEDSTKRDILSQCDICHRSRSLGDSTKISRGPLLCVYSWTVIRQELVVYGIHGVKCDGLKHVLICKYVTCKRINKWLKWKIGDFYTLFKFSKKKNLNGYFRKFEQSIKVPYYSSLFCLPENIPHGIEQHASALGWS